MSDDRKPLSFLPVLPALIAGVTASLTLLCVVTATAGNGLPPNTAIDRTAPAFRLSPNPRQPDFTLPPLPSGRVVTPEPPRVVIPRPPIALPGGLSGNCPQVFAPVCGRIGNSAITFSNSCRMRAAGAVPVSSAQCRGG
ncbi:MAG: hypothetical protein CML29_08935 [Rhizobiales bacterium]|nr:hypothetical protein [Hyphomicrobiales bacterium]MBG18661.1 hypothetical protein [Hyphomicrobiales bacterium]